MAGRSIFQVFILFINSALNFPQIQCKVWMSFRKSVLCAHVGELLEVCSCWVSWV